jgi:peptidyl-prolyl cis-trans isomerase B (cyclophilin B)
MAQSKTTTTKKSPSTSKSTATAPVKKADEIPGKTTIKITTDIGVVIVRLYDATPKHRDNFVKLVEQGFYDSLLFHRIIQGFMIQGGDPMSKNAEPGAMLGMGGGDMERIPAEFDQKIIHKKGALAAARDGNPEKASSACQFYIVQGNPTPEEQLDMMSKQKGYVYTPEQKNIYTTLGGTPFLDMEYTVFGEVVSGLNVIDKIAAADKDGSDRPKKDIHMKMELIK